MAGFQLEHNLPHQNAAVQAVLQAVQAVLQVLGNIASQATQDTSQNPVLQFGAVPGASWQDSLRALQRSNGLPLYTSTKPILDIAMETGTGKTYVYTKTIFELNRAFGLGKFIIAVPRVAIKAGTVAFLHSEEARAHFDSEYPQKRLKVYAVQSQKQGKNKKERMPQAILEFCRADLRANPNAIHVLVINAGMINSPTLEKVFDQTLFDRLQKPYQALAQTCPVLVIDEPHLFKTHKKTFHNLARFAPQLTLRYGATFDNSHENLVHRLTAVQAFNQDLVKGIVGHVERFDEGKSASLKLTNLGDANLGDAAEFQLQEHGKVHNFRLQAKDSLGAVHAQMQGLSIVRFNKSCLELSNGLELRKGDSLNPYSYSDTLQNKMLRQAIARHFELEKKLLTQSPRIKPLTLFFIDNIPAYREKDGAMRVDFERELKAYIKGLLQTEENTGYKNHLQMALADIAALHGGYFSKDNANNDEAIEQEMLEILHDKQALLRLDNPRRFIFSKWTLREGWDNPNIFQICKLRSSGSETSKLQEVGRGLRLPVNEYMVRVKDQMHELHYCVDFSEGDFIAKLTAEINEKSGAAFSCIRLEQTLINKVLEQYPQFQHNETSLLKCLDDNNIIRRNNDFREEGFEKLRRLFPKAFGGQLKANKVKSAQTRLQATIRKEKYEELRQLWEHINQKVVLQYRAYDEMRFKRLLTDYLTENVVRFTRSGSVTETQRLSVASQKAHYTTEVSTYAQTLTFRTMSYHAFLQTLSECLAISIHSLHAVFCDLLGRGVMNINHFLSGATIRRIQQEFNTFLMERATGRFSVGYRPACKSVHPTKLTNTQGEPHTGIDAVQIGHFSDDTPADAKYLYEEIFFDSELEQNNIRNPVTEVLVYAKIPARSIRIPLIGGGTYSPDFAYVVTRANGNPQLNLVVESKGKTEGDLNASEQERIKQAALFFNQLDSKVRVQFVQQLKNEQMRDIIRNALECDT